MVNMLVSMHIIRRLQRAVVLVPLFALLPQIIAVDRAVADSAPLSAHRQALLHHRDQPTQPALVGSGGQPQALQLRAARTAQTRPTVFGFLPYWISADYYESIDFDLLTHIAPFSVEINPDGSIGEHHGWPWTALVDRAHRHGVRVMLTATLFGDADVHTLLSSETHRTRFMRQIRNAVQAGSADGVIVDFEGPGQNGWPDQLGGFLRDLTDYLHAEIPGSEVSFASPAIDWGNRWDFAEIAASCDYLFVMGYAFSGSWSSTAGATAPLEGPGRTVASMLSDERDYGQVVRDHPEKLILGVPYYGCRWKTSSGEPGAGIDEFINYPRLRDAMPQAEQWGVRWDERSQTAWYRYPDGAQWTQVWFDDMASLRLKYALALNSRLRGFGLWALGYEGTQPEPWQLIEAVNGRRTPTWIAHAASVPTAFQVDLPYPNPFNAQVGTSYRVRAPGRVQVDLYDVLGRRVRSWNRRVESAGPFAWRWDGRDRTGAEAASGMYSIRFRYTSDGGSAQTLTRRIALLR